MGWLKRLFGSKGGQDEAAVLFEKLNKFLNSDLIQNEAMPAVLKPILTQGGSVDTISGATGEFGLSVDNPVPVNGPIGEVTYLSALRLEDGRAIWAHRLGAIGRVDVYEIVSEDGQDWFLLYLSPYHPRKSNLTPRDFRFHDVPRVRGIFATNANVPNFPFGLQEAIREWSIATLGMPLRSPGLTSALETTAFERPIRHLAGIQGLPLDGHTPQESEAREILLIAFTHKKLLAPLLAVMRKSIGYEELDVAEVMMFCASAVTYCYLRFGPKSPDFEMLERFHLSVVEDMVTGSLPLSDAVGLYQVRYREYSALILPVLDPEQDQRHHMTTLFMHICERASHTSARGKMINITASSVVIAALLDDTFKFTRKLA